MKETSFISRLHKTVEEFENVISVGGGKINADGILETFLDNGGEWLYAEGYVNAETRMKYEWLLRELLKNNKKVEVVYED